MSILAMLEGMGLSDLQDFEIHAFGRHGPVKEGKMPVVVRKSHCQFHLCHTFSLAQKILELSLSNCYRFYRALSTRPHEFFIEREDLSAG